MSESVWSGLDVGKRKFDASWVEEDTEVEHFRRIPRRSFDRTPEGIQEYLQWLQDRSVGRSLQIRVIMEATGRYSLQLCAGLVAKAPQLAPAIVNPKQAKHFHKSLGLRNKTDPVDSRSLGLMGKERKPAPYQEFPPEYQKLRELVRYRRELSNELVAEELRQQEIESDSSIKSFLRSHIRHLKTLLRRLDRELKSLLDLYLKLTRDVELLITIPGVGRLTALTVLAELGDLRRFRRSRQISAMAGLCPNIFQSGDSLHFTRINRNGNSAVRKALYMPALCVCRYPENPLAKTFLRLQENGLSAKAARVAVMRKLLVLMRAIIINQQSYQVDYAG